MRTIGRWTLSGILAVAAVGALSLAAAAQSRQFTFAYDQPKGSGYDAGADIFDKKLKELSNGALSINKYPGAQLGTEAQTMQKVQTGDIDFVLLSTANASTAQPESGVFSIHFIFRDENHAIKVLGDPKVIAAMHDLSLAGQYADRLLLFDRGRLVAEGRPEAVLSEEAIAAHYGAEVRVIRDAGDIFVLPRRGRALWLH